MGQEEPNNALTGDAQSDISTGDLHRTRTHVYGKSVSTFVLLAVLTLPAIGAAVASAQMAPEWQSTALILVTDTYSVLTDLSPSSINGVYGVVFTLTILLSAVLRGIRGTAASDS
jgi:hypothetical protein